MRPKPNFVLYGLQRNRCTLCLTMSALGSMAPGASLKLDEPPPGRLSLKTGPSPRAAVAVGLGIVENQFQCRVIWLAPLLAVMCVLKWEESLPGRSLRVSGSAHSTRDGASSRASHAVSERDGWIGALGRK